MLMQRRRPILSPDCERVGAYINPIAPPVIAVSKSDDLNLIKIIVVVNYIRTLDLTSLSVVKTIENISFHK